jgi:DNA repair exonuclease SbcCD nuclease subunit
MTYSLEIRGLKINLSGFPFVRGDIRRGFKDVLNQTGYDQLKGDLNLLITHHPFEGAAVGPVNFTFKGREDTIKLSDIPVDFHAVLAGHIHRRQVLNSNSTPVIFCGSTERTSFAEMEETKGYVKLTFCEKLVYEFIDLPTRPMHRITIPESVTQKDVIPYIQNKIADLDEDSIIRLECKSDIYIPESVLRMIIPDTMNIEQGYKKKAD